MLLPTSEGRLEDEAEINKDLCLIISINQSYHEGTVTNKKSVWFSCSN